MGLGKLCFAFLQLILTLQACTLITISPLLVSADTTSPWIAANPTLSSRVDLPAGSGPPSSINGNRDCQQRKVITRPEGPLPQQSKVGCVIDTNFGAYNTDGLLQRPGTNVYGLISSQYSNNTSLIPIPFNDSSLFSTGNSSYGMYVAHIPAVDGLLSTAKAADGSVSHKMKTFAPIPIADASGQRINVTYDSMAFSVNGNWLIADIPFIGYARISTQDYSILPFGDPYNYNNGTPGYQAAISPDGRYAAIASRDMGMFRVYDLSTCGPVPSHITGKASCQYKDLFAYMKQRVAGFYAISSIRFHGDYNLDLYAAYRQNATNLYTHVDLSTSGAFATPLNYLGMGDSFSSGEGVFTYKAETDNLNNHCHTSLKSYPYLTARDIGLGSFESVACSGAVIKNITADESDDEYQGQVEDGLRRKDRDIPYIFNNYLPGFLGEVEFVARYQPKIITISTVGNDIGFSDIIKRCVSDDTCYSTYEERLEKLREIDSKFYELSAMYTRLKSAGTSDMRIYAVGYPELAYPEGSCANNVHLNRSELRFANDLVDYLDDMIHRAADKAGVFYVDMTHSLDGHRFCETNSWEVAANGLTAGTDQKIGAVAAIGNESFHPNTLGHQLMEQAILASTEKLTAAMPNDQPALEQPKATDDLTILNVPKAGRTIYRTTPMNDESQPTLLRGDTWHGSTSSTVKLAPGSKATVEIHSTPITLGTFVTDASGGLDFTVTIPTNIEPGFHTINIYSTNVAGESVDIQKVIYVGVGDDDTDGDGLINEDDGCRMVPNSGNDVDKDGTDDACDSVINEPLAPAELSPIVSDTTPPSENTTGETLQPETPSNFLQPADSPEIAPITEPTIEAPDTAPTNGDTPTQEPPPVDTVTDDLPGLLGATTDTQETIVEPTITTPADQQTVAQLPVATALVSDSTHPSSAINSSELQISTNTGSPFTTSPVLGAQTTQEVYKYPIGQNKKYQSFWLVLPGIFICLLGAWQLLRRRV